MSVLWAVFIAWTLYLVVVDHDLSVETRFWRYFVYSVAIPVLLSIPPAVMGYYGKGVAWCWIEERKGPNFWISGILRIM
jgi:hypothetical protein